MNEAPVSVEPAAGPLGGVVTVPGDKSIAHRAVMLNSMASGVAHINGLPGGLDVGSTVAAMKALGVSIEGSVADGLVVNGRGLALAEPTGPIDCGNSGTTMRLLTGLLAAQPFTCTLVGDASLSQRPMRRVADPLAEMGAEVETSDGHAPLTIRGRGLRAHRHVLEVASAQVKSALILAGMQTDGETAIEQPARSRDHTERMLCAMGVPLDVDGSAVTVNGPATPRAIDVNVCGDPSSAAFFAVAGLIVPGSEVVIDNVCLNPTRTGFLDVLLRMGADLDVKEQGQSGGEPVGSLTVRACALGSFEIEGGEVPATIDELPVLAVAAACGSGRSRIRGARELRAKESDRIAGTVDMLRRLGATVDELDDGMEVQGGGLVGGAIVDCLGDHRLAMSAAVAALVGREPVAIEGASSVAVSFPGFFEMLEGLRA